MTTARRVRLRLGAALLAALAAGSIASTQAAHAQRSAGPPVGERAGGRAGGPRLAVDELRRSIEARLAELRLAAPAALVGVAVRDLATGAALDIAGDTVFHAASTMKLPVMVELFRQADRGGLSLDQEILLVNQFGSIVDGSPYSLDPGEDSDSAAYALVGRRVAVRELMRRMIVRSSNLATNAVIALVGPDSVTATARALGARATHVRRGVEDALAYRRGLNNVTTASDLAALLAAVERGGAVSRASSRAMLDVLLAQEVNDRIPAGVPPGTPVAHKTGEITAVMHDAAIVYPPGRAPYVLVVLSRGIPDASVARRAIVDISRLVYDAVAGPRGR